MLVPLLCIVLSDQIFMEVPFLESLFVQLIGLVIPPFADMSDLLIVRNLEDM